MSQYTNICVSIRRNLCKTLVVKYRKTYSGIALTVASHCFKARNQFTMFCIHFIDKFEYNSNLIQLIFYIMYFFEVLVNVGSFSEIFKYRYLHVKTITKT